MMKTRFTALFMFAATMFACMALCLAPTAEAASTTPAPEYLAEGTTSLLVFLVSFDADGDGVDDYIEGNNPKGSTDDAWYGEQWCTAGLEAHYATFFDAEKPNSIVSYYKEISLGKFGFVPAKETEGVENDGIISVSINCPHPEAFKDLGRSASMSSARAYLTNLVIDEADEYIDFSQYDTDSNKRVTPNELTVVMLLAGCTDGQLGAPVRTARYPFAMDNALCQSASLSTSDGVTLTKGNGSTNIVYAGEYRVSGFPMSTGIMAHEIAHALGANDLYNTVNDENTLTPGLYSVMSTGSYICQVGTSDPQYKELYSCWPSYLDPYHRMYFGWYDSITEVSSSGEYSLFSTLSGKYNLLKILTPDPMEYFLVELRITEGCEEYLAGKGKETGGILVWHIDEDINNDYFEKGRSCAAGHKPGIRVLAREDASAPMYYFTKNVKKSTFDTDLIKYIFNSAPEGIPEDYGFKVQVISDTGSEMKVNVTMPALMPYMEDRVSVSSSGTIITATGRVENTFGMAIKECGFIYSTDSEPSPENSTRIVAPVSDNAFSAEIDTSAFTGMFYIRSYCTTDAGTSYSSAYQGFPSSVACAYYYSGEKLLSTAKYVIGSTLPEPAAPSFDGMDFIGWFADTELTVPFEFGNLLVHNTNIYAKFEPIETTAPETTTAEPTTAEPTTAEPTTAEPTTAEPTTAEPATAEPATAEPTTAEPDSTAAPDETTPAAPESNGISPKTVLIISITVIAVCAVIIIIYNIAKKRKE